MERVTVRKISCRRCRYRKLKCTRTEPCQSCLSANQPCEYREADSKRRPASAEYTSSLEKRVAWLENFIKDLQNASPEERSLLLQCTPSESPSARNPSPKQGLADSPSSLEYSRQSLHPNPDGSLSYHGPTSIYSCWPSYGMGNFLDPQASAVPFNFITDVFGIELNDQTTTNGLVLFFRWHYPYMMFIYREAFLRDHFGDQLNRKYWSPNLCLAMCALGLQVSDDESERELGNRYFTAAESASTMAGLPGPSILTVQTFLCLAFYALSQGSMSKSWNFSGIAFRMAEDLGFHKDPKDWIIHDLSIITQVDIEIRRRIYWGCYISDKLISLILGRSVQLSWQDATVELTDVLPDFPQMQAWLPAGCPCDLNGAFSSPGLIACFQEQIRLSNIIERALTGLASLQAVKDRARWEDCISDLNLQFHRWKDALPVSMRWNEWDPPSQPLIPIIAALHLLLFSTQIAINFDIAESPASSDVQAESKKICLMAGHNITCLVKKYRQQHGIRHAPMIMVYSICQAMRSLRNFGSFQDECNCLHTILGGFSTTLGLAAQALVYDSPAQTQL